MVSVRDADEAMAVLQFLSEYRWLPPKYAIVIFKGGDKVGQIEVKDTSGPLTGTVTFLDAEEHPTTAGDTPVWASDNEDAATVAASDDGLSATITIGGPGAAIISVTTTNEDGSTATAQGTITVTPGDAVIGSVEFSEPQ